MLLTIQMHIVGLRKLSLFNFSFIVYGLNSLTIEANKNITSYSVVFDVLFFFAKD